MATSSTALILSYRECVSVDFDYSEAGKTVYNGLRTGRLTRSATKICR